MKECFRQKEFGTAALQVVQRASEICDAYTAQGLRLTVRQLFYQFVGRNWLANTDRNYNNLAAVIAEARDGGLIDWDHIEDRGRITQERPHFPTLKHFLQEAAEQFRLDHWASQKHYVEVQIEKQALEGVVSEICDRWSVPLTSNKGYSSASAMYRRGKIIQTKRDVDKKIPHALLLCDHDPSGIDMTRDVRERLARYSDGYVEVIRLGLNFDQVQRHKLPENPVKLSDGRAKKYVELYGESSWELDALDPMMLVSLVEHGIRRFVDVKVWDESVRREQTGKDSVQTIVEDI